jgi:hypothetical protein
VDKLLNKVLQIVNIATDGTYNTNVTKTIDVIAWNYDAATGKAKQPYDLNSVITCSDCFATVGVGLEFSLQITSHSVQYLLIAAAGSAKFSAGAQFKYSKSGEWSGEKTITTITSKPIEFFVGGIPFTVQFIVPINVGYDVSAAVDVSFAAHVNGAGSIRYGFEYYPKKTGSPWINEKNFAIHGGFDGITNKREYIAMFLS